MKIIKKNKDAEVMVCQEIRDGREGYFIKNENY